MEVFLTESRKTSDIPGGQNLAFVGCKANMNEPFEPIERIDESCLTTL